MMRVALIFLLAFLPLTNSAQDILPMIYDTNDRKQEFILNGSIEFSATSISNSLTNYFIGGGEIPLDVRQSNFDKQNGLNRMGFMYNPEFEYRNYCVRPFKKKEWGILAKAGMYSLASSRYTDGAFGLAFLGNEPFLGQRSNLSNSYFAQFDAHKIGFGVVDSKSKSSVTLNLYGIRNFSSVILNESYLEQDADGFNAEISLNGSAEFLNSNTYYQGIGVGLDANFIIPTKVFNRVAFVQFQVQNVGAAFFTAKKVRYEMDTIIQFSGYELSDLIGDNALFDSTTNLMDEIGLRSDTVSARPAAIPFTIQIGKIIDEHSSKKFQTFFGFRAFYQKAAIPQVYLGVHYRATNWLRMGLSASYGGFSKLRVGYYATTVFRNFNLGVGTNNLVGLISKKGNGHAFVLRLNYVI